MTAVDNSASRHGAALRRGARRGLWRGLLSFLGVTAHTRRADARAALWELGGEWEQRTADMLAPLEGAGWRILHDRRLPGRGRANLDHVLVLPNEDRDGVAVIVLDTKRWDMRRPTCLVGGRVHCGWEDRHEQVEKVARYAVRVADLLGLPAGVVSPMLVVHGSRIVSPGFPGGRLEARTAAWPGPVHVLGPQWLVPTLAAAPRGRDPQRAAALAARVERVLPPYRG